MLSYSTQNDQTKEHDDFCRSFDSINIACVHGETFVEHLLSLSTRSAELWLLWKMKCWNLLISKTYIVNHIVDAHWYQTESNQCWKTSKLYAKQNIRNNNGSHTVSYEVHTHCCRQYLATSFASIIKCVQSLPFSVNVNVCLTFWMLICFGFFFLLFWNAHVSTRAASCDVRECEHQKSHSCAGRKWKFVWNKTCQKATVYSIRIFLYISASGFV